jgi:hypothetical protein
MWGFIEAAVAFTPAADYTLSDVEVFVFNAMLGGIDNTFEVSLDSDSAGLPGTEIAGSGGYAQTQTPAIETLTMGAVELIVGTQYWLVTGPGGGTYTYWAGVGSISVPAAYIDYNGELRENGGQPPIHQLPMWLPGHPYPNQARSY